MNIVSKVHENAVRRRAKRLGLELYHSRARRTQLDDRGLYRLAEKKTGRILVGDRYELELSEIEEYLTRYEEGLK